MKLRAHMLLLPGILMVAVMAACEGTVPPPSAASAYNSSDDNAACKSSASSSKSQSVVDKANSDDSGNLALAASALAVDFTAGTAKRCRVPFQKTATGWIAGSNWLGLVGQGCRYDPIVALINTCNAQAKAGKNPSTCVTDVGATANPPPDAGSGNPTTPSDGNGGSTAPEGSGGTDEGSSGDASTSTADSASTGAAHIGSMDSITGKSKGGCK